MEKFISNKFVIGGIVVILFGAIGFVIYHNAGAQPNQSPKTDQTTQPTSAAVAATPLFIKTLTATDGSTLGDIYVTFIGNSKDTFSSLFIVKRIQGQDSIIFKANDSGLYNTQGRLVGPVDNFYGYAISALKNDSFTLFGIGNQGKNKTADMTIVWDTKEQALEIVGIPVIH